MGGYESARQAFLRVLQLRKGDPDALCGLAAVEAATKLSHLTDVDIKKRKAYITNVFNTTMKLYEEAKESNCSHPLLLLGLGNSAFLAGEEEEKADDYDDNKNCSINFFCYWNRDLGYFMNYISLDKQNLLLSLYNIIYIKQKSF